MLQQSQPVVAVAERPLSRREEMALKALSLEEVLYVSIFWKTYCHNAVVTKITYFVTAVCNKITLYIILYVSAVGRLVENDDDSELVKL